MPSYRRALAWTSDQLMARPTGSRRGDDAAEAGGDADTTAEGRGRGSAPPATYAAYFPEAALVPLRAVLHREVDLYAAARARFDGEVAAHEGSLFAQRGGGGRDDRAADDAAVFARAAVDALESGRSSVADAPLALTEAALRRDWGLPVASSPSTESTEGAAVRAAADVARAPASEAYASRFARRCAAARAPIARSEVLTKQLRAADVSVETMKEVCNIANFSVLVV